MFNTAVFGLLPLHPHGVRFKRWITQGQEDRMSPRHHLRQTAFLSAIRRRRHAVVVGSSLAGMLSARVLSDHFDRVTLLDRDCFPETPADRKGLPQGRHVHVLLERGRATLERFHPGVTGELVQAGALLLDANRDVAWMNPYGWYVRFPGDLGMLACSRNLIDWGVRRRLAALPNVRVQQGADVVGLIRDPKNGTGVAGVRLRRPMSDCLVIDDCAALAANLVVVADGRNSRLPEWLAALGYNPPEETVIDSFQGYASRLYRQPAAFESDWKALYIQQAPPEDPRGGLISPVEGGRWLVSLVGGDGDYPPIDEAGFLAFARSLRSTALYEAIQHAEPLSPIAGQRATENRLRHYDRLDWFPEGVVVVGDAACAFNPVYGQGMTAAALGAETLDRWLRREWSKGSPRACVAFQHDLGQTAAAAWQLSAGADHRFRTTIGPAESRGARLVGRYVALLMQAATRRPWLRQRLAEVFHLIRPPRALFGPGVLARLACDRFAAGAGTGSPTVRPSREATDALREQREGRRLTPAANLSRANEPDLNGVITS
jgi:2-polyprenyl-6-methoxyphenol hydroxylase-like FAD-dependent oxidoreductase